MHALFIILPCYNEVEGLGAFWRELSQTLDRASLESHVATVTVFVDDGSSDATWDEIRNLKGSPNQHVCGVRLVSNFGHQAAIQAGCEFVGRHPWLQDDSLVVIMDADGQHPIDRVPDLVRLMQSGVRHVQMVRDESAGGFVAQVTSDNFYRLFRYLSKIDMPEGAADFRGLVGGVLKNYLRFGETGRFNRGLFYLAEPPTFLPYEVKKRMHGVSKYSLRKMLKLAFVAITNFANRPLIVFALAATLFGFAVCAVYLGTELYRMSQGIVFQPGWFTIMAVISLWGMILSFCVLLLSLYVGRIFDETKRRPVYLVREEFQTWRE